jgi:hypothetical protein
MINGVALAGVSGEVFTLIAQSEERVAIQSYGDGDAHERIKRLHSERCRVRTRQLRGHGATPEARMRRERDRERAPGTPGDKIERFRTRNVRLTEVPAQVSMLR